MNDSILKSSIIILFIYGNLDSFLPSSILSLVANASFLLPSVIFAGLAGRVSDRFERTSVVRIVKFSEILIVIFGIYALKQRASLELIVAVGFMGTHSAFFGPLKYSMLPDQVPQERLLLANGLVEGSTLLTILFGTIIGGLYNYSSFFTNSCMIVISVVGFVSSLLIPRSNNYNPEIKIRSKLIRDTVEIVKYVRSKRVLYLSILGNSWFWFLGISFLGQVPILVKNVFNMDESVVNLFLTTFSLGVGVGSFVCSKILKNNISTEYTLTFSLVLSIFIADLFFATKSITPNETFGDIYHFINTSGSLRIIFDLFALSVASGIYVVPLQAMVQKFSPPFYRSRVIAANNVYQGIFMTASTIWVGGLLVIGLKTEYIILSIGILNLAVAWYIYKLMPEPEIIPRALIRSLCKLILDAVYRVKVRGMENFYEAGKRVVIIANHTSYLDSVLLAVYLPENVVFAINTIVAKKPFVKPLLKIAKAYSIDSQNPLATKHLIAALRKNKKVVIFPEGRMSNTGSLMKVYEGPGAIAERGGAVILPVSIDGAQYTPFSRLNSIITKKYFPKITITIMPAIKIEAPQTLDSKFRRKYISQKLYDVMLNMAFESSDHNKTLVSKLFEAASLHGYGYRILEDVEGTSITYRSLIVKSSAVGRVIARQNDISERVGIMLPTSIGAIVTFYGMQLYRIVPVMINFTSGTKNILNGCRVANVKTIYTSRKFIQKAELENLVETIGATIKIVYLEDIASKISITDKISSLFLTFMPKGIINKSFINDPSKPSVILFTSGTEGFPKAVVLSHTNIQSNICQNLSKLDFNNKDIAFNALPMFHCFGLMGTILMISSGVRSFVYPSPLHYKVIPELIYDAGATILFTTNTFLNGYAKHAHQYDFYSIRYIFAGAEKVTLATRNLWFEQFGAKIFEGYGATEASPVISMNTPMHNKINSVGKFVPGMQYKIKKIDGIDRGGLLYVYGPNVMLGYISMNMDKAVYEETCDPEFGKGWYNTGDIVEIDEDGYIFILGRYKRFAKIGGEMISLLSIEELASQICPTSIHAAIIIVNDIKGEQIILFTNSKTLTRDKFVEHAGVVGAQTLSIPKDIIYKPDIPILNSGKIDYRTLEKDRVKDFN